MDLENMLNADLGNEIHPHRTAERTISCGDCVVSHCNCCACFGFEYGGIHLTLDRDGFARLIRVVQRLHQQAAARSENHHQKYYLQLPGINVKLVFRQQELPVINALLARGHAWLREAETSALTTAAIH